ncbi:Alb1-domain-containing protein [Annulohypoxylon truncatum]|uniref:Alb1-domain-containing protein n=1 Tax=Annulohypoxylon truncatum TaxID=327061 RepID=UPI0020073916|nr:Alb1-domain-containing protein [Annulohypoxylon truncatum]KAI1214527.1 Alb1-domain-containing protein [Annulohypoxylon truncatum]
MCVTTETSKVQISIGFCLTQKITAIMGKGTIAKKKKGPSIHSRAARRATSPGIDTDKSLKNVQPPAESVDYRPSILSIHQGAGVTKKTKKSRNMSSKARKRYEKGQDRAAAVMDRTEKKINKSKGQARIIQTRRKTWDEVNNQIPATKKPQAELDGEDDHETSELDDEMYDAQIEEIPRNTSATDTNPTQENREAMEEEQEDEIL